MQLPL